MPLSSEAGGSSRSGCADSSSALHELFATTPALRRATAETPDKGKPVQHRDTCGHAAARGNLQGESSLSALSPGTPYGVPGRLLGVVMTAAGGDAYVLFVEEK